MSKVKEITAAPKVDFTGSAVFRISAGSSEVANWARAAVRRAGHTDVMRVVRPEAHGVTYRCNVGGLRSIKRRATKTSPAKSGLRLDPRTRDLLVQLLSNLLETAKEGAWPTNLSVFGIELHLDSTTAELKFPDSAEACYARDEPSSKKLKGTIKSNPIVQRDNALPKDTFLLEIFPQKAAAIAAETAAASVANALENTTRKNQFGRLRAASSFQSALRQLRYLAPETAEEGQAIAKQINDALSKHGSQLVFPGTEDSAILVYLLNRATGPGAFALKGKRSGKLTTMSISQHNAEKSEYFADLSQLEVRPAPLNDELSSFLK